MNDDQTSVGIGTYLLQFTGIYLLVSILVMAFVQFTGIDPPSVVGMLSVMVAAMVTGQSFASKHKRVMARGEKVKFATFSALIACIASLILALCLLAILGVPLTYTGVMTAFAMPEMPGWVWLLIFAAAFIISAAVAYFTVNITAKAVLTKQAKP